MDSLDSAGWLTNVDTEHARTGIFQLKVRNTTDEWQTPLGNDRTRNAACLLYGAKSVNVNGAILIFK